MSLLLFTEMFFKSSLSLAIMKDFLCPLRSIATHRDHFVRRLSVRLSGSHTFLVVTHSYVSQVTHALLGMLPLCFIVVFGKFNISNIM